MSWTPRPGTIFETRLAAGDLKPHVRQLTRPALFYFYPLHGCGEDLESETAISFPSDPYLGSRNPRYQTYKRYGHGVSFGRIQSTRNGTYFEPSADFIRSRQSNRRAPTYQYDALDFGGHSITTTAKEKLGSTQTICFHSKCSRDGQR